jgi:hypothetical protein
MEAVIGFIIEIVAGAIGGNAAGRNGAARAEAGPVAGA